MTFGQIQEIKVEERPYTIIPIHYLNKRVAFAYEKSTDKYSLVISSDNEYEEKIVTLYLGKGAKESILSLRNLSNALGYSKKQFQLQGYNVLVESKKAVFLMEAAGNYFIDKEDVEGLICKLVYLGKFDLSNAYISTREKKMQYLHPDRIDEVRISITIPSLDNFVVYTEIKEMNLMSENRARKIMSSISASEGEAWTEKDYQIVYKGIEKEVLTVNSWAREEDKLLKDVCKYHL